MHVSRLKRICASCGCSSIHSAGGANPLFKDGNGRTALDVLTSTAASIARRATFKTTFEHAEWKTRVATVAATTEILRRDRDVMVLMRPNGGLRFGIHRGVLAIEPGQNGIELVLGSNRAGEKAAGQKRGHSFAVLLCSGI
jgi:hypothetical protein